MTWCTICEKDVSEPTRMVKYTEFVTTRMCKQCEALWVIIK